MTFPNLEGAELLAIDIETKDPNLEDLGPGPRRNDGHICGIGVADGTSSFYFSVQHPNSENIPLENIIHWLNNLRPKAWAGANLLYDLDWLESFGFAPTGKLLDVQLAEPLLDENKRSFSLENLAQHHLGLGKGEEKMAEFCLLNGLRGKPQKHIYKMPASVVGPYCQQDCELTFDILKIQEKLLAAQDLTALFDMECKLLPLLLKMRRVGVRIDTEKLAALRTLYMSRIVHGQEALNAMTGLEVNVMAPRSIKKAYEKLGIPFALTEKGNPTFDEAALSACDHPLAKIIVDQRHLEKTLSSFIDGLGRHVTNGRIHCQFHPLRGDQYGTVSGRFSSSNPNLQQMPSTGQTKNDIRGLFVPEENCDWLKLDYSQIELRVLAHYARGDRADDIRKMYVENPDTDFHQACADMIGVERKQAKNINFGVVYGMGRAKLAQSLGLDINRAVALLNGYHAKMPFLKKTSWTATGVAERRGYIKTLLGRRRRFPDRRWCYKALNALVQGSAADIMKAAMVRAWEDGIFNALVPHLTVHDELDCSVPKTAEGRDAVRELKRVCETAVQLNVPLIAECVLGSSWADEAEKL